MDNLNYLFATSDLIFVLIFAFLGLIFIFAIVFLIVQLRKYRHRIRVRVVAADRKFIIDDRFKVIKDDEGVIWWHLLKRKHNIPVAPSEAIEITHKGQMVVEAYYTDEGEYVYVTDEIKKRNFNNVDGAVYVAEKVQKKKHNLYGSLFGLSLGGYDYNRGRYVYIKDRNKSIDGFQPFTTKQRLILVNQYKKAQARKKFGFLEHLPQIVSVVALVIILLVVFIFWENITAPSLQAMDKMNEIASTQAKITESLQEIIQQKQILKQAEDGG